MPWQRLFSLWNNWVQARCGIAEFGRVGTFSKSELANVTARREAIRDELKDSRPYIEVMREQIGDSLAESEREVMEVIEQIGLLNKKAIRQREHIAQSIQSGKALTESTHERAETTSRSLPPSQCRWRCRPRSSKATSSASRGWPAR